MVVVSYYGDPCWYFGAGCFVCGLSGLVCGLVFLGVHLACDFC